MKKHALVLSFGLNLLLGAKIGWDHIRSHAPASTANFTPDRAAQYARSLTVDRGAADRGSRLLAARASEPAGGARAHESATGSGPGRGNGVENRSETRAEETVARWEDQVTNAILNEFRLSAKEVDRYQQLKQGYQRELAEYVTQHSTPDAEYFVPTLEDQRAMIQIKDRYALQMRQSLGEEHYAAYRQMLRDFNAAAARQAARSPAGELAIVEF